MTKRSAPESGFDVNNSSKRQVPNHASASNSNDHADSIQPNSAPHPDSHDSATQRAPQIVQSNHSHHQLDDDSFVPEPQTANAPHHEEAFVPNDSQRNELAKELSGLQSMPASAIDQISDASIIPDEDQSQHEEEDQGEDIGGEQPTPESSPRMRSNKNRDKFKSKKKKKKNHYEPILWKDGAPDPEAACTARKSDALICGTTNIILDTESLLVNGTLWKEVLLDELPDLLRSDASIPLPPEQDKYDFLKACYRMGSFIEPNRMSRLLGGGYRTPQYCAFLLQGFLGLLNNPKVRRVLKGGTPQRHQEDHRDVVVYADQLYPSDDEILVSQENEPADPEDKQVPHDGNNEVAVIEESDREEEEGHKEPPRVHRAAVHETRHKSTAEQRFLAKPSYVLRNYMANVTGQQITDIDDFEAYCSTVGATFLSNPSWQPLGRLKWLKERMPAPEMGPEGSVSGPLELWRNAIKTYSARNLSRCALIRVDPLLDWLCFAENEAEPSTSEEEYFREKRPVVAIAPVALLYLADMAVDFALRILTFAVQTEELSPLPDDEDATHLIIDDDDVISAARYLREDGNQKPPSFFCADLPVLGDQHSYNRGWPGLIQRPLTASECLELCDRTPKVSISIPKNITEEMRAVLMSFRQYVKRKLYAFANLLTNKDPLAYMPPAEKAESYKKRRQRNLESGIIWSRKPADENDEVVDDGVGSDNEGPTSSAKKTAMQMSAEKETSPGTEGDGGPVHPDRLSGRNEFAFAGNGHDKRTEKLPKFFDQVNVAELIAFRIGDDELRKRKSAANRCSNEDEYRNRIEDAALFLKQSLEDKKHTISTVCFHRLGWICLHALGITVQKSPDDIHPMGYASSANYTNFAQFRTKKPVVLTTRALYSLAQMADVHVREEASVLMACAAHDDGRPWIDRADVALVTSVRKEDFNYKDL